MLRINKNKNYNHSLEENGQRLLISRTFNLSTGENGEQNPTFGKILIFAITAQSMFATLQYEKLFDENETTVLWFFKGTKSS